MLRERRYAIGLDDEHIVQSRSGRQQVSIVKAEDLRFMARSSRHGQAKGVTATGLYAALSTVETLPRLRPAQRHARAKTTARKAETRGFTRVWTWLRESVWG